MKRRKWSNAEQKKSLLHLHKVEISHGESSDYLHLLSSITFFFFVFTFTAQENER
jgi:hypothetical protein